MTIEVSPVVRNKAIAAGAEDWLAALPALVGELEAEWGIAVGRSLGGGTEAFVAEAVTADGEPAVVKLLVPRSGDAARHEITVLRLADGDGCPRLLRYDEARSALLLERLGPSLHDLGVPVDRRHEILVATAQRIWRPLPPEHEHDLPTGRDKALWLKEFIAGLWDDLDRPCSEAAVTYAFACADRRAAAHDDERAVLVHGDVHQWNALQAGDGFKLVDPDGLRAEAEYDLGILMREDPVELLAGDPRDRARRLAAVTGLDAEAIWEWGVVERVSTGLLCTQIGLQPVGEQMLAAADAVADGGR